MRAKQLIVSDFQSCTLGPTDSCGPPFAPTSSVLRFLIFFGVLLEASGLIAEVEPLTAKEVSLMLRSGYSSQVVLQELAKRKFADTFNSSLEKELVKANASQSLIDALRSGAFQSSEAEIAALKAKQTRTTETSTNLPTTLQTAAPSPPQIGGTMYDHFRDDLVYWHEGSLAPFDNESLERKKFYLLFFSAIWSKEGRQFTSQLVDYYNRVHPQHPEFETVFFSADRSAFAMENYISQTQMPWPAVAYDKLQGKAGALAGRLTHQIPRLILAEASGRILSDSGETRPEFGKVLNDLDKVLAGN